VKVLGTVGHPIKHIEIKIVDMKTGHMQTGQLVLGGSKGIVKIRGLRVMNCYYKVRKSIKKFTLNFTLWINLIT
jgi:long-chain acyl-CoA synthetase